MTNQTPPGSVENGSLAWNDPTLEACEGATCPCGHEALDHAWHGCEECGCTRSGIHAVLASGAVQVSVIPPAEKAAPECLICRRPEHEHRDRNGHGFAPARVTPPVACGDTGPGSEFGYPPLDPCALPSGHGGDHAPIPPEEGKG